MSSDPMQALFDDFSHEAAERLIRIEECLFSLREADLSARSALLEEGKRQLHTLKGNSGMMGFKDLQQLAHGMEDAWAALRLESPEIGPLLAEVDRFRALLSALSQGQKPGQSQTPDAVVTTELETGIGSVRISFSLLDPLVEQLAEMVIFKNRLEEAIRMGKVLYHQDPLWDEIAGAQESLGKSLAGIQDRILRLRLVPLRSLFAHLRRIVADESSSEGKVVKFSVTGGETPMDKAVLEVANEALGHLVRNAVIHGIERPAERSRLGKPSQGRVNLSAVTHAGEVQIDVEDDGHGVDHRAIAAAAEQHGLKVSDEHLDHLLFMPGISTKQSSDMSSGRGMGLSAALKAAQRLGGRISVHSEPQKGTRFRIHLPLSVSITRTLLLVADNECYALPLSSVLESVRFQPGNGHTINSAGVMSWRKRLIPILDVGCAFNTATTIRKQGFVVFFKVGNNRRGLVVDEIVGIREIVVKGLDSALGTLQGISGSTVLGDGKVILILDPQGLIDMQPFVEAPHE